MFPAGLEPATFRVWGGRDNHYTTETHALFRVDISVCDQMVTSEIRE